MPRRKKVLALPAQAGKDIKTITGLFDKYATHVEEIIKDVFEWAKKHKMLVIVVIAIIAAKRYWLDEESQPDDEDEEERY